MTQQAILDQVAICGGQAGFWAAVAFPVVTAFYWPWWRRLWALTIVALDLAIALALLGSILVIEFGMNPDGTAGEVFEWVEAIALCLIPVIIIWRGVLTFITQRRGNRSARSPGQFPDGRAD